MSRRRRPTVSTQPRPLNPSENIRSIIREELTKALQFPEASRVTPVSQGYLQSLAQSGTALPYSGSANLARDPYNNDPFGPGEPLYSAPLDPVLPSGRAYPRTSEFPVSWNLQLTDTRTVPWSMLRDAADRVSVIRACIKTCKAALTGLEWSFGVDSTRAVAMAKRANVSAHTVAADLQDKYADDIDRLHTWWQKPDRIRQWNFVEWLTAVLEDALVLDAVSLYPHMTVDGNLHSLELIDSSTIKPLRDHRGTMPMPPLAAFQQILYGFPRGEFMASPQEDVDHEFVSAIYGPLTGPSAPTDALIYKVQNVRAQTPYGFSPVEQALADIDLWLRRWDWLRSEYSAGVTPEMVVKVDAAMTAEQLRQYEAVFNDDLSGRTAERHRARFLPAGFEPFNIGAMDSKYASDFDLHLIRLICASFDVLPTSLGFTPNHGMGGMGGMGHQQAEQDTQQKRGAKPTAQWITDLINEVSVNYLGMPLEVTFRFHGLDDEDEQAEATLLEGYVKSGMMTLNETRDALNLPRYTTEKANEPFIVTPTGPAFIDPDVQPIGLPGNLPSVAQPGSAPPPPASPGGGDGGDGDEIPRKPRDEQVQQNVPGARNKQLEQKAFMRRARAYKSSGSDRPWRNYRFVTHEPWLADAANTLAAEGDTDALKELFTWVSEGLDDQSANPSFADVGAS